MALCKGTRIVGLYDTREQSGRRAEKGLPPSWEILAFPWKEATLVPGDAGIEGLSGDEDKGIIFERKEIGDLAASVTKASLRFTRSCQLMSRFEVAYLVVEGTKQQVLDHDYRSQTLPKAVLAGVDALVSRWGIHIEWAGGYDLRKRVDLEKRIALIEGRQIPEHLNQPIPSDKFLAARRYEALAIKYVEKIENRARSIGWRAGKPQKEEKTDGLNT